MINGTNINLFFVSTKHSDKKNKLISNLRRDRGFITFLFASLLRMKIDPETRDSSGVGKQKTPELKVRGFPRNEISKTTNSVG